jgi:hypothetical protein
MFPVSVCFGIESERFVEEETQRKRLLRRAGTRARNLPFPDTQPKWSLYFE